MGVFWHFVRAYPSRSLAMIGFLMLGLLAEALGLSTLLTILIVLVGDAGGAASPANQLDAAVRGTLRAIGAQTDLGSLLLLFVVAMLLQAGLVLLSKRQVGFTVARVASDLRLLLVRSLAAARWSYFTRQPAGSLASSVGGEAAQAAQAFLSFATVLTIAAQGVLYAGLALLVSWRVTVAACLAAVVIMLCIRPLILLTRKAAFKNTRLMRSLLAHLTDGLAAVKPLKAMARESLMSPLLERETRRIEKTVRQQILAREGLRAVEVPLSGVFVAAGIYLAVTWWGVPVAELGILVALFLSTLAKLSRGQRQYQQMVGEEQFVHALRQQIDDAMRHREVSSGSRPPSLERSVTLEDVELCYGDLRVLEGACLEIPAGRTTAIVGRSGAGKTTLADLVCGLVRPDRGRVRVDGVSLDEIDLRAWRRSIGYVPQDVFLVNDTLRENVTLGDEVSDAAVEAALRRAGAWDFVSMLPEGIQSPVGERGALLSGGQRQRICIARALVHDPKLLILDEATAALDPESEAQVWESLERLRGQLTVLAISHQSRLLSAADRVYLLENGKVELVPSDVQPHAPGNAVRA